MTAIMSPRLSIRPKIFNQLKLQFLTTMMHSWMKTIGSITSLFALIQTCLLWASCGRQSLKTMDKTWPYLPESSTYRTFIQILLKEFFRKRQRSKTDIASGSCLLKASTSTKRQKELLSTCLRNFHCLICCTNLIAQFLLKKRKPLQLTFLKP